MHKMASVGNVKPVSIQYAINKLTPVSHNENLEICRIAEASLMPRYNDNITRGDKAKRPPPIPSPWTHEAILLLLNTRINMDSKFNEAGNLKKRLWMEIASVMMANGFDVNGPACHKKWRNLLLTYRKNRDKAEKCGEESIVWDYFTILHSVFSQSPPSRGSNADRVASTNDQKRKLSQDSPVTSDDDENYDDAEFESTAPNSLPAVHNPDSKKTVVQSPPKKHRGNSSNQNSTSPLLWFKSYLENKATEDRKRDEREEQMWKEYKELEERKLVMIAHLTEVLVNLKGQKDEG